MFACSDHCSDRTGFSPWRLRNLLTALALVVLAVSPHAQVSAARTTITGRVVAEATGQPVGRAYVIVHGPYTKTTRVTMSDGEGNFRFDGLPTDRYRVGASKRPLLSAVIDATAATDATAAIGADVVISLPTGAVVTGTVVDHHGRTESGIGLNISGPALTSPQLATTNHTGEYRFFSLPPGEYTIAPAQRKGDSRAVTVGPAGLHQVPALSVESSDPPAIAGREARASGTAVVAGVVTDARTGGPLANARVVNRASRRHVVADANGRWEFGGLGAATWEFLVEGDGFLPTMAAAVPVTDNARITDVRLRAGRNGSIAGVVRDEVGDPVVNMPVVGYLKRVLNFQPMLMGRGHARTDDRGMFEMRDLPPGKYLLCACAGEPLAIDPRLLRELGPTAPDAATVSRLIDDTVQTFAPAFYPGLARASDSQMVAVDYGDARTGMDITMHGVRPFALSGKLVDSGGQPVFGMQVYLAQDGDVPGAIGVSGPAPVNVAADGLFRFSGLAPGTYAVIAVPVAATGPVAASGQQALWGHADVTIVDRDVTGFVVPVGSGLDVTGRVEFSGNSAPPTDGTLEKARVSLIPLALSAQVLAGMANRGSAGHGATLDSHGRFTITGVPLDRYRVAVTVPNSPWRTLQRLASGDAATLDDTVSLGPTGAADLVITMSDVPLATLTGTVPIDPTRYESVGFLRVYIFPMDTAMWLEPERHPTRFSTVWPKADGSFRVDNLPPGDYYVARGSSFDADMSTSALERWAKTAERVTLRSSQSTSVVLKAPH